MTDLELYNLVARNVGGHCTHEYKKLVGLSEPDDEKVFFPVNFTIIESHEDQADLADLMLRKFERYGICMTTHILLHTAFQKHSTPDPTTPGIWVFEEGSIDDPGKWMELPDPVVSKEAERAKIEKIFASAKKDTCHSKKNKAAADEYNNMNFVSPIPEMGPTLPPVEAKIGQPVNHTVVFLGGYRRKEDDKALFFIQNFCPEIPLFLASAEFLKACEAKVVFPLHEIGKGPKVPTTPGPGLWNVKPMSLSSIPGGSTSTPLLRPLGKPQF